MSKLDYYHLMQMREYIHIYIYIDWICIYKCIYVNILYILARVIRYKWYKYQIYFIIMYCCIAIFTLRILINGSEQVKLRLWDPFINTTGESPDQPSHPVIFLLHPSVQQQLFSPFTGTKLQGMGPVEVFNCQGWVVLWCSMSSSSSGHLHPRKLTCLLKRGCQGLFERPAIVRSVCIVSKTHWTLEMDGTWWYFRSLQPNNFAPNSSFLLQTSDVFVDRACLPITPFTSQTSADSKQPKLRQANLQPGPAEMNEVGVILWLTNSVSHMSRGKKRFAISTPQKRGSLSSCEWRLQRWHIIEHLSKKQGGMRGYVATPWKKPCPKQGGHKYVRLTSLKAKPSESSQQPKGRKPAGSATRWFLGLCATYHLAISL